MSRANFRNLLKRRKNGDAVVKRRRAEKQAELLNAESALGRNIFGSVPEGQTREFFYHDKNAWIWHENGLTMRYEVRPHGVFKRAGDGKYQAISGGELENFRRAARAYLELMKKHMYA